MSLHGRTPPPVTGTTLLLWHCPVCDLDGQGVDSGCLHCHGTGFTDNIAGWEDAARPAPRPPAVMARPCADCAFRIGSPEQDEDWELRELGEADRPFWCHQGMPLVRGGYSPTAMIAGIPLGYKVCGGWWDWVATGRLPAKPYRELVDPAPKDVS